MIWKTTLAVLIGLGFTLSVGMAADDAAATWKTLSESSPAPAVPDAWNQQRPEREVLEKWRGTEGDRLLKLGGDAAEFAQKYPEDPNAAAAHKLATDALFNAFRLGRKEADAKLSEIDAFRLKDTKLDQEQRISIRARQVQRAAQSKASESPQVARATYIEGARAMAKEFPGSDVPYRMMVSAAKGGDPEASKQVLKEIAAAKDAPEEVKEEAAGMLANMELLGKPLDLKFTALDGREVDVQKMKGQVVLIDFWATWCGPCVQALPELLEIYKKHHGPKFEIIGIDLDDDKAKLQAFIKERGMAWPQHFDGKGFENAVAQRFGIDSIPRVWLVDKKGILREMEGRQDLEAKIQKLLDE